MVRSMLVVPLSQSNSVGILIAKGEEEQEFFTKQYKNGGFLFSLLKLYTQGPIRLCIKKEAHFIKVLKTVGGGYNLSSAGYMLISHTPETIKKIRDSNSTPEEIAKLVERNKQPWSLESRKRAVISAKDRWRKAPKEDREKIGNINRGKKLSVITRKRMSKAHRGLKCTEITKARMSFVKLGNQHAVGSVHSHKTRIKQSLARKKEILGS